VEQLQWVTVPTADVTPQGFHSPLLLCIFCHPQAMTSDPDRAGPGSSGGGPSLVPPRSARPSAPPSPQSGRAAGGGKPPGSTGGDATVGAAAPAPDISAASSTQQLEDGGTTAAAAGALPAGVPDPLAPPRPSVTFGADMRTSFTRINAALSQSGMLPDWPAGGFPQTFRWPATHATNVG
jgi:hypothetical protein